MPDCIFCKIVKGEMPSTKVYEDSDFLAFMNIYPASKGHALLIPKNHIQWMQDADDSTVSRIFLLAKKLMDKIRINLPCDYVQINVIGEEIQHFHIHFIPRHFNKKIAGWDRIEYDNPQEIEEIAKKLQSK